MNSPRLRDVEAEPAVSSQACWPPQPNCAPHPARGLPWGGPASVQTRADAASAEEAQETALDAH